MTDKQLATLQATQRRAQLASIPFIMEARTYGACMTRQGKVVPAATARNNSRLLSRAGA